MTAINTTCSGWHVLLLQNNQINVQGSTRLCEYCRVRCEEFGTMKHNSSNHKDKRESALTKRVTSMLRPPRAQPSLGGDVTVYVFDINQPNLPTPFFFFFSVLMSVTVFMTISTVFHSINSLDNSPLSHSVLPVLVLQTVYLFMKVFFIPDIILCGWLGLKH